MENGKYQELVLALYTACANSYPEKDSNEVFKDHISLLKAASDISGDVDGDLASVLSMMTLSVEKRPDLSFVDRISFVYGMSRAKIELSTFGYDFFNRQGRYEEAYKEFRIMDENLIDRYNIDQASLGYEQAILWQVKPRFLEKK